MAVDDYLTKFKIPCRLIKLLTDILKLQPWQGILLQKLFTMETLRDKRKELRAIQKAQDETNDLGQSIALSMQFEKAATEYLNIKYPKPKKSYEV